MTARDPDKPDAISDEAWLDPVMSDHDSAQPDRESLRMAVQAAVHESWLRPRIEQADASLPQHGAMSLDLPDRIKQRCRAAATELERASGERPAKPQAFETARYGVRAAWLGIAAALLLAAIALPALLWRGSAESAPDILQSPVTDATREVLDPASQKKEMNAGQTITEDDNPADANLLALNESDDELLADFEFGADEFLASHDKLEEELESLEEAMTTDRWLDQPDKVPSAILTQLLEDNAS